MPANGEASFAAQHGGKPITRPAAFSNFNIHSICDNCYQIVHSAPSAILSMLFVTDNCGDPEVFAVGFFEIRMFDGEQILTADERGWTPIRKF